MAVNLFVGRPFQAVVAAKYGQFQRPEKGVLRFLTASKRQRGIQCGAKFLTDASLWEFCPRKHSEVIPGLFVGIAFTDLCSQAEFVERGGVD